ncbi:unnamed protein product (macronuclear) [Paramecium tetraurelia]|uniref:Gustatory receptor n=1 Tax=Paramecium tetraurelia TaxID=5888 RepID=A0C4F7_PARTE|nr:uncharacterized protein GSPATT00035154001 [Paramecium tetraurelia]CAK65674.1 unnamed protein product [Paramecium tetraurelia]|eukprot:XP_001433071.1 hypothetical protein (macronuclear) [Paramecium tetraurelia strain d4-2]
MQQQMRNKQIGIVTKVATTVHTILLFLLVVSACLKLNQDFLISILLAQAVWQQLVIETLHLRLNRFNYLEEQEQIRKRFGLSTQKSKDSSLWYYRKQLILPAIVLALFLFTEQSYEDLEYCFISVHGLLQIYQGSIILVVGIRMHIEQNDDYNTDLESEGLIMKSNMMLRRSEVRTQRWKTFVNLIKKFYVKALAIYFCLSVIYEFYAIFLNMPPFDLLSFICNYYQTQVSIYALIICQLQILLVLLYIGNAIIQKRVNRVKRLYEHVTKEQEKLFRSNLFIAYYYYIFILQQYVRKNCNQINRYESQLVWFDCNLTKHNQNY